MTNQVLSFTEDFDPVQEQDWLESVAKALKGGGLERLTRQSRDQIAIRPLYRETDFPAAEDPLGEAGQAPFLRGGSLQPDPHLPWDIRQQFTHPAPARTNHEVLRDLERGVSSVEIVYDPTGRKGVQLRTLEDVETALGGLRADIATLALDPCGSSSDLQMAGLIALWAGRQDKAEASRLAFNIDPLGTLARSGRLNEDMSEVFHGLAQLIAYSEEHFPEASVLRADGRIIHEAGGSEAQELAGMIASAVDTLRRLDKAGIPAETAARQCLFTVSLDGNYGLGIAKLRAARRLWASVQTALELPVQPMRLQAVTSARMLTRYDSWVNILRGTAACFAGAAGGADCITVRPFNEALGVPEELGRRIARNTQLIAMEESGLGRVLDPGGGAWFSETLAEALAQRAWKQFQEIEAQGGYASALIAGDFQKQVKAARETLIKSVAHGQTAITGVSAYPLIEDIRPPSAMTSASSSVSQSVPQVDPSGLQAILPDLKQPSDAETTAEALSSMRLSAPFENLRDRAETSFEKTGHRPSVFLATLGPLSSHTARADFARNFFASAGLEAITPQLIPENISEIVAAYRASGCQIAVICGSDQSYSEQAEQAASALRQAGTRLVWLAGKMAIDSVDRQIHKGCDAIHELTLALAVLNVE